MKEKISWGEKRCPICEFTAISDVDNCCDVCQEEFSRHKRVHALIEKVDKQFNGSQESDIIKSG
jgi:hypothetical protein